MKSSSVILPKLPGVTSTSKPGNLYGRDSPLSIQGLCTLHRKSRDSICLPLPQLVAA